MKKTELVQLICNDLRVIQDEAIREYEYVHTHGAGDLILNAKLEVNAKLHADRILIKFKGAL